MLRLPAAFLCGVRVKTMTDSSCEVTVRHRWINQNPFRSLYWAVQGMAAELSTGVLVMAAIREREEQISMLVAQQKGEFNKKATGRITFSCNAGDKIKEVIDNAVRTGEAQTCWLTSKGIDNEGDQVSLMAFEWTIKVKQS